MKKICSIGLTAFLLLSNIAHASDSSQPIREFRFTKADIVAWQNNPVETDNSAVGPADSFIKDFNSRTGRNFKPLPPQPGIIFRFTPPKAKEFTSLTEEIADPVYTDNNLVVYFDDVEISRLRVAAPIDSDRISLVMPPERLNKLEASLPQEKKLIIEPESRRTKNSLQPR